MRKRPVVRMPEFYTVFPGSVCLLALLSLKSCLHQSLHSNCMILLLPKLKTSARRRRLVFIFLMEKEIQ